MQSPCRPPLVCVEGLCESVDGAGIHDKIGDAAHDQVSDAQNDDVADAGHGNVVDLRDDNIGDARPDDTTDRGDLLGDKDVRADGVTDATDQDGTEGGADDGVSEPDHLPRLVVAATTNMGRVWLFDLPVDSIDSTTPGGLATIDVTAATGVIGSVDDVETQATGQIVHVMVRAGSTVYATYQVGQSWATWEHVADDVLAMGLANLGGVPFACLVGTNGHLRLARRQSSGAWEDLGDVVAQAASLPSIGEAPRRLIKLDCAGIGSDLEIMALDQDGQVWEAVKGTAGWTPFSRLAIAAGFTFLDVDISNESGSMDLLASSATDQYHAIRDVSGVWTGLGSVRTPYDPVQTIVAGAQTAFLLEVEWLQLSAAGKIWMTTRYQIGHRPFVLFANQAPDGDPFMSVSATAVFPF